MPIFSHRIAAAALLLVIGTAHAQAPATVRLDYIHSGNALSEQYDLTANGAAGIRWTPNQQQVVCQKADCSGKFVIWDADIKEGKTVRCLACNTTHRIRLTLTLDE